MQEHGVAALLVVNATLSLAATLPATSSLVLAFLDRLSRVPVTDRTVTLRHQGVDGNVVLLDVVVDLLEGPVRKRVDLDHARIIKLNDVEISSFAALTTATPSDDSSNTQLSVRALSRLDLSNIIIKFFVGLP